MNYIRSCLIAAFVVALSACASNSVKYDAPPIAYESTLVNPTASAENPAPPTLERPDDSAPSTSTGTDHRSVASSVPAASSQMQATSTSATNSDSSHVASTAVADVPTQAERDALSIYGQPEVRDPWERFNRRMHRFNTAADKAVARPMAVAYKAVTPDPVENSVTKFFGNLRSPGTAINQVLQGRPIRALQSVGRFAVNSTLGVGGLFDPASHFGMPKYNEDFGQTMATWGWRDSRYLVLPLMGPRTARDAVGILVDQPLSPLSHIKSGMAANGFSVLQTIDGRARLLPMDAMREQAVDDYALVRDVWMQRRNGQVDQDRRHSKD